MTFSPSNTKSLQVNLKTHTQKHDHFQAKVMASTHLQQQHELEAIPELLLDALDEGARLPQV